MLRRTLLAAPLFLSSAALLMAAELPVSPEAGRFDLTIESQGTTRTAMVYIPNGYRAEAPPPVVITMHGAGGGAASMMDGNGWTKKADAAGFIVVAPEGLPPRLHAASNFLTNPRVWNSGQLRENSPRAKIDDIAYIRALLDELAKRVPYDNKRVYAAGHSNGGGMAFRLGAEMSDRLAAISTVAGQMAVEEPKPDRPLPTLYILGTEDPLLPLAGGESTLPWGKRTTPPVKSFLTEWAEAIGCLPEPRTLSEDAEMEKVVYPSANDGPTLTVLYLKGHGHAWPGANRSLPARQIGPITSKLNATDIMWEFFDKAQQ